MKKITISLIIFVLLVFLALRAVLPSQLDDLSPGISCSSELIEKSDILFVIPNFELKNDISKNKEWCKKILSFNKSLALHGYTHEYREFSKPRSPEYVHQAFTAFRKCFNQNPAAFKPPNLAWNSENDWIEKITPLKLWANQIFHKVYHCSDAGGFPNWLIDLI